MSKAIALVAEPDHALRHLMRRVLLRSGYDVFEIANALQLEICLRAIPLLVAPSVFFVLGAKLAAHTAHRISDAASKRSRLGLPDIQVVLTHEPGGLASAPRLALSACRAAGVLEKPFDLRELRMMGLRCGAVPATDGSRNASA